MQFTMSFNVLPWQLYCFEWQLCATSSFVTATCDSDGDFDGDCDRRQWQLPATARPQWIKCCKVQMPRRRTLKKRTRTMACCQEYDIWERGSGKEALVINSIETHKGFSVNAAIHLSCTKQIWNGIGWVYTWYIPSIYLNAEARMFMVYTRYIPSSSSF